MFRLATSIIFRKPAYLILVALLAFGAGPLNFFASPRVVAGELAPRSIKLSDSRATIANVSHEVSFDVVTPGIIGSIAVMYCSNSPLVEDTCVAPVGFDASSVTLASQAGETGFTVYSGSTANNVILTRPPAPALAGTAVYVFEDMVNPDDNGPLYARILTYPSSDASGTATDSGGLAMMILSAPTVSTEVPPYLLFCLGESISGLSCNTATEPFSDIGVLSPLTTGAAQSQLIIATNAENGYTMWALGGTMTSGNNTIPAMAGGPSQEGVSQFGINLRANTDPIVGQDVAGPGVATVMAGYNQQNQFRYQSGDTLATANAPDDYRKYTVSYIVNVADGQPGGVYSTTLTYITLANF